MWENHPLSQAEGTVSNCPAGAEEEKVHTADLSPVRKMEDVRVCTENEGKIGIAGEIKVRKFFYHHFKKSTL